MTTRTHALNLSDFELGVLWGFTMREDIWLPQKLQEKIAKLVEKAYEKEPEL